MREIKFRLWNGMEMEYNIMAGFLGSFYVQGIDEKDSASMSHFNTKYPDMNPLMQFTGLRDKNGVEIYEGDVVKFKGGRKPKGEERPYVNSVVVYKKCIFTVEDNTSIFTDSAILNFCVVIGNIHENPELLTKTH